MRKSIFVLIIVALFFFATPKVSFAGTNGVVGAGDKMQFVVPAFAGLATLMAEKQFEGFKELVLSYAAAVGVANGLKLVVHEKRPDGSNFESFPSGHAASAFAGACFIHLRYGFKPAIPFYVGALFVGYSRVEGRKHYWGDVAVGAGIAFLSNLIFTKKYLPPQVQVIPTVGDKAVGLNLSLNLEPRA